MGLQWNEEGQDQCGMRVELFVRFWLWVFALGFVFVLFCFVFGLGFDLGE